MRGRSRGVVLEVARGLELGVALVFVVFNFSFIKSCVAGKAGRFERERESERDSGHVN